MTITEAMKNYFLRLEALYRKTFGTLPTVSWEESMGSELFCGKPDDDGEIQWKAIPAKHAELSGLCSELTEFYNTYYYWELRGQFNHMVFDFPAVTSFIDVQDVVKTALAEGQYYFAGQDTLLLATCSSSGNDDLLLFYRQHTGELFIYDQDKRFVHPMDCSLVELIESMEAII